MTRAESVFPVGARDVLTWDLESDVVIVGYGAAGACAAITARAGGADVLVLERAGGGGGASQAAAGYLYLGGGTALQKACGLEDTPDNMFAFLLAATGPGADEAKLRVYCDESAEHFDWVAAQGVPFKASVYTGELTWEVMTDDGLTFSGGENAYPFNNIAVPVQRAHIPQMTGKVMAERSGGWLLMQKLSEQALDAGVKAEYDIRVQRLVVDEGGEVIGLVARRYGEDLCVRARRGVILTAGGFGANDAMVSQHSPRLIRPRRVVGTAGDDGSGIRMAQAAGADVRHMDAVEAGWPMVPSIVARGVVVNGEGQRFINEDTYPGRIGQHFAFRQGGNALIILDDIIYDEVPAADRRQSRPNWVCGSLAELEEAAGLPTGSLESTIGYYNEHAAKGEDPLFHKDPRWLRPLEPPFGALDRRGELGGVGFFTLGGLRTDVGGEVLDLDGEPIPGLFAAGRCASGVPAWGYLSGTSLGDSTFFGRRAGTSAARRT